MTTLGRRNGLKIYLKGKTAEEAVSESTGLYEIIYFQSGINK